MEKSGTIDELNAHIGNIFDQKIDQISNIALLKIQNRLFDLGSNIAYDHKNSLIKLQHLDENDVLDIEREIDRMEKKLPILTNFILPSGLLPLTTKSEIKKTMPYFFLAVTMSKIF